MALKILQELEELGPINEEVNGETFRDIIYQMNDPCYAEHFELLYVIILDHAIRSSKKDARKGRPIPYKGKPLERKKKANILFDFENCPPDLQQTLLRYASYLRS